MVFLPLTTDEDHAIVQPFLESQMCPDQRVYFDDGLTRVLGVSQIPTTLVLNKQGQVSSRMNGFAPRQFKEPPDRANRSGPPGNDWKAAMCFERVIWIVLASVGIGVMPDAESYGDKGSDTLGNLACCHDGSWTPAGVAESVPVGIATTSSLLPGSLWIPRPSALYGKADPRVTGAKTLTTGHWEMVGIHLAGRFLSTLMASLPT